MPTSLRRAARKFDPQRLGLGTWRVALGNIDVAAGVFSATTVSPNESPERTRRSRSGRQTTISTHALARARSNRTRSACSTRRYCGAWLYRPHAGYRPDLGRTLGLLADWWVPATRRGFEGGWLFGLCGWGVIVGKDDKPRWFGRSAQKWT